MTLSATSHTRQFLCLTTAGGSVTGRITAIMAMWRMTSHGIQSPRRCTVAWCASFLSCALHGTKCDFVQTLPSRLRLCRLANRNLRKYHVQCRLCLCNWSSMLNDYASTVHSADAQCASLLHACALPSLMSLQDLLFPFS